MPVVSEALRVFHGCLRERSRRLLLGAALLTSAVLPLAGAQAADTRGDYAVRGVGALPCGQFLQNVSANRDLPVLFAWIDGVLTATNRNVAGVFDAVPFSAPGAFGAIVLRNCRSDQQQSLDGAVRASLQQIQSLYVSRNSPMVEMTVASNRVTLRAETLRVVQDRLRQLNLLRAEPNGIFTPETREALKRFQAMRQLPSTELPDPDTVFALVTE